MLVCKEWKRVCGNPYLWRDTCIDLCNGPENQALRRPARLFFEARRCSLQNLTLHVHVDDPYVASDIMAGLSGSSTLKKLRLSYNISTSELKASKSPERLLASKLWRAGEDCAFALFSLASLRALQSLELNNCLVSLDKKGDIPKMSYQSSLLTSRFVHCTPQ